MQVDNANQHKPRTYFVRSIGYELNNGMPLWGGGDIRCVWRSLQSPNGEGKWVVFTAAACCSFLISRPLGFSSSGCIWETEIRAEYCRRATAVHNSSMVYSIFSSTSHLLSSPYYSSSLPSVTLIRGHIAGTPPSLLLITFCVKLATRQCAACCQSQKMTKKPKNEKACKNDMPNPIWRTESLLNQNAPAFSSVKYRLYRDNEFIQH